MKKIYSPTYFGTTLIAALLCQLSFVCHAQQTAPVYPPSGGMRIEGNLQANNPLAGIGDWIVGPAGSGGYVLTTAGIPLDTATTIHFVDAYSSGDDIFTGSHRFDDDPNTWSWGTGSSSAKTDVNNVLIHFTKDSIGCHKWMMFAADRLSSNGTSYVDFEFLQNTLSKNAGGTFTSGGTNGGRTVNDLLLTLEYTNGGANANLFFYKWAMVSSGVYDWITFTPPSGTGFGFTSAGGEAVPYNAFGSTIYVSNQFVEGAVDLDAAWNSYLTALDSIVFKTLFIMTKTSLPPSTPLSDFVPPKQLNNLTLSCLLGIEENTLQKDISVFPNPATETFTISSQSILNGQLEIYTMTGERIFHTKLKTSNHETFDISALAPGIYSVRIVTDKGSAVKKMVKE